MNRFLVFPTLFLALTLPLAAEGAGGVEFTQTLDFPGTHDAVFPLRSAGGFGYGVLRDGTVVGGWGMGGASGERKAGFGGTMEGWQHRFGPLVALLTTKVGFGGVTGPNESAFALMGAAEVQVGVLVLPWFNVGLKAGAEATAGFYPSGTEVGWTPLVGLRLSWGAY